MQKGTFLKQPTISVVYFSGTGNTEIAANAVLAGCESVSDVDVVLIAITGEDIDAGRWSNDNIAAQLDASAAIIFGTPTYMGSVSAQFKAFMDAMAPRWYTGAWRNKIGAAFTVSSLISGDKLNTLNDLVVFAMQMGMIWCGTGGNFAEGVNSHGFYLGAGLQSLGEGGFSETDVKTAEYLGQRVAGLTLDHST